jgi:hypothetical protein
MLNPSELNCIQQSIQASFIKKVYDHNLNLASGQDEKNYIVEFSYPNNVVYLSDFALTLKNFLKCKMLL